MTQLAAGDWLTVEETADLLRVSVRRVQALITRKNQPLKATPMGLRDNGVARFYLLLRADVEAFKRLPKLPAGRPKKADDEEGTARKKGGAR